MRAHSDVTDFAVRHDNPGGWMFHCHILGHAEDLGMAGELHVDME